MGKNKKGKSGGEKKLTRRDYEKELARLHAELVRVQRWITQSGNRIVVIFEGRDAAGKGGTIKAITERVSPRVFRVVALPAPTDREKSQMYIQRYMAHLPSAGEIVIFDRSWYNRAGVERVMGFCTEAQHAPIFEQAMVESGIQLIKYWMEVGMEQQEERFRDRIEDPRKIWKLSPMDVESYRRWYDYSRARDDMLAATDRQFAPWHIVRSNDKRRARLNCITHLLSLIDYEEIPEDPVHLGNRDMDDAYDDQAALEGRKFIPEPF